MKKFKILEMKKILIIGVMLIGIILLINNIYILKDKRHEEVQYVGKIENKLAENNFYKSSNSVITLNLKGTDDNYLRNDLTVNDVVIKVNGNEVTPSSKILSAPRLLINGVEYTLTLNGVPENGSLTIDVIQNTLTDAVQNKNILETFNTGIIMDNVVPEMGIGSIITYNMRDDENGNPVIASATNNITYGVENDKGNSGFYNTDFSMIITTKDELETLRYKITTQDVENYDDITNNTYDRSYSNIAANTTKTETVNLSVGTGKLGKLYYIYVRGEDKAGNIGYSKRPIYIWNKYQTFVARAFYNILGQWWSQSEETDQWVNSLYEGRVNNNFPNSYDIHWEYYNETIKINVKYMAICVVLRGIYFSPEFLNHNYSNADFIRMVYRGVLLRDEVITGSNSWLGGMNAGMGRDQILGGISSCDEAISVFSNKFGL